MTSPYILSARDLRKNFGRLDVLHGVDLEVDRGEFLAVMGPSGSGKSTLLNAISGLDAPTAGSVEFDGTDLTRLSQAELGDLRLNRMGFVFQQVHLLKNLTLLDNVVLPGFLARADAREAVVARGRELMRRAGVGDLADRDLTEASGGQLQRVGICRALINDPSIVFADEPTGALDSAAADAALRLLTDMCGEGTTLVMVTHDARVAAHAERVLGMVDGLVAGELSFGAVDPDDTAAVWDRQGRITEWLRGLEQLRAA